MTEDYAVPILVTFILCFMLGLAIGNYVQYGVPAQVDRVAASDQMQFVSNTEYSPGQEGQIAIVLTNATGYMVTFSYLCNYTMLYPTKMLFQQGDYLLNSSVGTYWTNFTVPDIDGVYEYESTCHKPGRVVTASKSFHVTRKGIRAVMPK